MTAQQWDPGPVDGAVRCKNFAQCNLAPPRLLYSLADLTLSVSIHTARKENYSKLQLILIGKTELEYVNQHCRIFCLIKKKVLFQSKCLLFNVRNDVLLNMQKRSCSWVTIMETSPHIRSKIKLFFFGSVSRTFVSI